MSTRSIGLDDSLYDYRLSVSLREPELFARLRRETETMPEAGMQISPEQGQFMQLLVKLIGASVVELKFVSFMIAFAAL